MASPDLSAAIIAPQASRIPTPAGSAKNPAGAAKAAQDFAAFFVTQSLESVYSGISADPLFGGGNGEQVFRSLMLQEYGKIVAKNGGLGIADAVQREILRLQEAS